MFPVFHLERSTWPATKHLLRVEEMQRADWLIGSGASKFVARQVVSLKKNEQQNQNLLLKVDPGSTFHNNFLQPATNVFVAGQVDYPRWKTGNIDENLQRNNVARQVEGFCISYFAAFTQRSCCSGCHTKLLSTFRGDPNRLMWSSLASIHWLFLSMVKVVPGVLQDIQ